MDSFVLQTSDSNIQNGDVLGRVGFAANEADTGDARAVSAIVYAMAEAPFTSIANPTSLVFATAVSGDAYDKLKITSSGHFLPFASGEYDIGSASYPFQKVFTDALRVADYNFPTSDGSTGQVLSTDGTGQLSFIPVTSASDTFVDSLDFNTSTNVLTIGRNDGVDFSGVINAGGGTVDGTGIANYVAKWVDSDTLTSGIIYDNGSNIGIGTANPSNNKLRIHHDTAEYSSENTAHIKIQNSGTIGGLIGADGTNDVFYIQAVDPGSSWGKDIALQAMGGKVGVGTVNPSPAGGDTSIHIAATNYPELKLTNDTTGHGAGSGTAIQLVNNTFRVTNRQPSSSLQFYAFDSAGISRQRLWLGPSTASFNHIGDNVDFQVMGSFTHTDGNQYRVIYGDASTGRLGIGTTNPLTALHVAAGIGSEGTVISQTADSGTWAGYLVRDYLDRNVGSFQFGNIETDHTPSLRETLFLGSRESGIPVKFFQGKELNGAFQHNNERMILDADGNTILTAASGQNVAVSGGNDFIVYGIGNHPLIYTDPDSGTGRVGIGRIPDNYVLDVSGSARINPLPAATHFLTVNDTSNNEVFSVKSSEAVFNGDGVNYDFRIEGDADVNLFKTNASTDNVTIGAAPEFDYVKFLVYSYDKQYQQIIGGGCSGVGLLNNSYINSGVTNATSFYSYMYPHATTDTLNSLIHFRASRPVTASTGPVTTERGFYADVRGATNNWGFQGIVPTGDNNYNLYMSSNAKNYLAGHLGIGTSSPAYTLDVVGSGRFTHAPSGLGLAVVNDSNSGLLFGENAYGAYSSSYNGDLYTGISHTAASGDQEYMLLSKGDHTFMSAKDGYASIIRGGNNNQTYQLLVNNFMFSVGQHSEKMKFSTSKVEFNLNNENLDFAVHGNSDNLFYVDANEDRVGIGTMSPSQSLDVTKTGLSDIAGFHNVFSGFGPITSGINQSLIIKNMVQSGGAAASINTEHHQNVSNGVSTTELRNLIRYGTNFISIDGPYTSSLTTTYDPKLTVKTDSGYVGIGTDDPSRSLHHVGDTAYIASNSSYALDISASAATLGNNRFQLLGTETVFNQAGGNYDFRVESEDVSKALLVDANLNHAEIHRAVGYGVNHATSDGWSSSTSFSSQVGYYGGNFVKNGEAAANHVEYGDLPNGARGLLWRSKSNESWDGVGDNPGADGGWNKDIEALDPNRSYLSVVYVRRVSDDSDSTSGYFYHGCQTSAEFGPFYTTDMDGSGVRNPYFSVTNASNLPKDVWCLSIGFIRAASDPDTTQTNITGIYRLDTGQTVAQYSSAYPAEFRMGNDVNLDPEYSQRHRTYLYYDNIGTTQLDWCWPGFYELTSDYAQDLLLQLNQGHIATSPPLDSVNNNNTVIQSLEFDSFGHVTSVETHEENYVNDVDFDTTTGILSLGYIDGSTSLTKDLDGRYLVSANSDGTGLTLTNGVFDVNVSSPVQTVAANSVSSTANRTYAVQVDSSDNLVVNIPWTDTQPNTSQQIQDIVGGMVDGNVETNIAVTYDSSSGKLDFEVGGGSSSGSAPTGSIIYSASSTAPAGFLKANGAAVSRSVYSGLFAAIGTTYGAGDGSTTFNLPDLRGEFIRGFDDQRGVDSSRVFGSTQADSFKAHEHGIRLEHGAQGFRQFPPPNAQYLFVNGGDKILYPYSKNYGSYNGIKPIEEVGDAETRPRNIALLACIKY